MILSALSLTIGVHAQVKTADLSPRTTVKQKVGLTEFELEYSRPSVRERKIFGEVIPFDKKWRTGANKNSMLTFDTEIKFGEAKIEPGTYSVFTKIGKEEWKIFLYADTENWGVPSEWSEDKIVAEVTAKTNKLNELQETFAITFENIGTESFDLVFAWEKTSVHIPVSLPTKSLTLTSIEKTMGGPSDRDYYAAASFYLDENQNLKEALTFIKKAVEMRGEEAFWYMHKQALIEHKLGQKKAAIATAKRSLASAEKAKYDAYIKLNKEKIEEWSE